MKFKGVDLQEPVEEILVLPHGGNNIVFRAKPVTDMGEFERLCPAPKPPTRTGKGGVKVPVLEDPTYLKSLENHNAQYMAFMVVKSLEATDDLTWERVSLGDPGTWLEYRKELEEAQFSAFEINRITNLVLEANCLNEAKLTAARESFLAGQREAQGEPSGQNSGQLTT